MSEAPDKIQFFAKEVTETDLCAEKELHLGYEFTGYMLLWGPRTWVVDKIDRDMGSATARLKTEPDSPPSQYIRVLRLKDGRWADQHTTINEKALAKVKFI